MSITSHYATGPAEDDRLRRTPHGRLEYLRTQEILRRFLPDRARILDVGGGTGVHAAWLAAQGHDVHLVDVVPDHVTQAATLPGVTAEVGDARELSAATGSYDVVLLLGPLYHLVDAADRARALAEARRVLRPGGLLAAAGISRYLSLLETAATGRLAPDLAPRVEAVIATGAYDGHVGFTTTHWHTADELRREVTEAGLLDVTVYGVEGPSWPALDAAGPAAADALLPAALLGARLVERDPHLIDASAHHITIAYRPS